MRTIAALTAALAAVAAAPAAGQPTITAAEIRTAPPEQTHQRMRDLIWTIFEQQDRRQGGYAQRPLKDMTFATRPRASEVPGLCRYDAATFEFAPLAAGATNADTPVRPVGLTTFALYHFLRPPTAAYRQVGDPKRLPEADGCTTLDTAKLPFFAADHISIANDATLAFLKLQQALRSRGKVKVECSLPGFDGRSCEQVIEQLKLEEMTSVDECDFIDPGGPCYSVLLGYLLVRIVTGPPSAGDGVGEVVRARAIAISPVVAPRD